MTCGLGKNCCPRHSQPDPRDEPHRGGKGCGQLMPTGRTCVHRITVDGICIGAAHHANPDRSLTARLIGLIFGTSPAAQRRRETAARERHRRATARERFLTSNQSHTGEADAAEHGGSVAAPPSAYSELAAMTENGPVALDAAPGRTDIGVSGVTVRRPAPFIGTALHSPREGHRTEAQSITPAELGSRLHENGHLVHFWVNDRPRNEWHSTDCYCRWS